MRLNPKQRFIQDKKLSGAHSEMVASPTFRISVDTALLNYAESLPAITDLQTATANGLRMEGAKHLVMMLETLSEPIEIKPANTGDNLKRV